jgi:hypothetical protein
MDGLLPFAWMQALRRGRQRIADAVRRACGADRPTHAEVLAARARVAAGCAGATHPQRDPGRDHCLARGYCCERGCRGCPWGRGRP